jgi:SAM-dependent methyltransferase
VATDLERRVDAHPYLGNAFAETHPDRLAALGLLCGLSPAPVGNARILEFGCGDGGNLIPLAYAMPQARFLGVDFSGAAISRGRGVIDCLALANIELRRQDILEFDPAQGPFDYVIAHGVYSWAPENVRERLLALCRQLLAPQGLAFVSYNALPGGFLAGMMREMLLYHVRDIADPAAQVPAARALVDALAQLSPEGTPERSLFGDEARKLQRKPHDLVVHDDLWPVAHREWKWSFAAAARRHGLRVFAEAIWSAVREQGPTPQVRQWLDGLSSDPDMREQYRDFLMLRRLREDILCRDDAPATHAPRPACVERLRLRAAIRATQPEPDLAAGVPVEFKSDAGATLRVDGAMTKAALVELGRAYPRSLGFPELFDRVERAVRAPEGSTAQARRERLAGLLYRFLDHRLVEITTFDSPLLRPAGERPTASRLARLQRERGPTITSLAHVRVDFAGERGAAWLAALDGTRDRAALMRDLATDREELESQLAHFHRIGLLVG